MRNNLPTLGATEWNDETIKKCKAQGEDNLYDLLSANPSWFSILEKEVKTMMGIK